MLLVSLKELLVSFKGLLVLLKKFGVSLAFLTKMRRFFDFLIDFWFVLNELN